MNRTKVLLLVVGALAVAATAYWQGSFDGALAVPPPVQLKAPTAPPARATSKDQAPATASNPAPAAPTANVVATASPAAKKPAARAVRKDAPPVVAVEQPAHTAPPSVPAPVSAPAAPLASAASDAVPVSPERKVFAIIHDHTSGNFDSRDPKATCVGELVIQGDEVTFTSTSGADHFTASRAQLRDVGPNRFFGSGIGGFHVSINDGGKYKNFNLAPQSKDKAEGKLILDLLRSHAHDAAKNR